MSSKELPPPLPEELTGTYPLPCPSCGLVTEFDLEHLLTSELLYCHDCCKTYKAELWQKSVAKDMEF